MESNLTETQKITAEEAQKCAKEEVQYIGTVQPHGFVLVADSNTHEIVQYSENFIQLLNCRAKKANIKEAPNHWK